MRGATRVTRRSPPRRALHAGTLALALAPTLFGALPGCAAEPGPGTPAGIARQTVASSLGLEFAATRVVLEESRDFPDASLDCPEPGMLYAQVITPGSRVIVEADGRRFDVRVAGSRGRICRPQKKRAEPGTPAPAREQGESARRDLALRLGIPADTIEVTGLRRLTAGESLPGCGIVCPAGALTCGTVVSLRSGDRDFRYVALPGGIRPCPDIAAR